MMPWTLELVLLCDVLVIVLYLSFHCQTPAYLWRTAFQLPLWWLLQWRTLEYLLMLLRSWETQSESHHNISRVDFLSVPHSLVVTHLQCQTHADISRNELVLLRLTGGMERGEIDARGGMVAGSVLMQDVGAQGNFSACIVLP